MNKEILPKKHRYFIWVIVYLLGVGTGLLTYAYVVQKDIESISLISQITSPKGTLNISSTPQGAKIYLDEKDTKKVTPAELKIKTGKHTLKLTLEDYQDYTQEVFIEKGGTTEVTTILEKKIPQIDETDETSDWKTFTSTDYGFSIKYPPNWVYKDYGKLPEGSKMVAFADKTSNLPAEQSDQPAIIGISIADQAISIGSLSLCPNNVKKENISIGSNISAIKWSTLGNCVDDMFGDAKIVTIEVKKSNGGYIHIENFNNQQKSIFEKMLTTFKFI